MKTNTDAVRYEVHTTYFDAPEVNHVHPITYTSLAEAEKFANKLYEIGHSGRHAVVEAPSAPKEK